MQTTSPAVGAPLEAPVRPYPLDVINCSGDECSALMSKGHHDHTAFLKAAEEYWGEPLKGFDGPTHTWWRVVPDSTGEYRNMYHEAKPHSRGAFPVTVMCQW